MQTGTAKWFNTESFGFIEIGVLRFINYFKLP